MKITKIHDISRKISKETVVWPGDSGLTVRHVKTFSKNDGVYVTKMTIGMHMATHVDAPLHYLKDGKTIDEMDLSCFLGSCKVFEIDSEKQISKDDVESLDIKKDDIVLFKTANSNIEDDAPFYEDYVYLSLDAAEYLIDTGVKTVGIDYLSIENFFNEDGSVHKSLLANGIVILEGLSLKNIEQGEYFISCLPLKVADAEASPVRAVLAEIDKI